ncbi:thioesterase family protein [Deinococcus pimensis]|uniref:thioesterase family protein n=1 Tax=Deinococcus pimensis TaxID=309888 RepID=UPI000481C49F
MDPRRQYTHTFTVPASDIDELGHVNNAVYLRYMEEAARAHADHVGAGLEVMKELGAVPVARHHSITYHLPAHEGDVIAVTTEITSAGGVRSVRHHDVRRASTGELLVEADTQWVWVDPVRHRPKRVPHAIMERFGWAGEASAS